MEELAESLILYNYEEERGMSIDIIKTEPKKYRILIDALGPEDCPEPKSKFWENSRCQ